MVVDLGVSEEAALFSELDEVLQASAASFGVLGPGLRAQQQRAFGVAVAARPAGLAQFEELLRLKLELGLEGLILFLRRLRSGRFLHFLLAKPLFFLGSLGTRELQRLACPQALFLRPQPLGGLGFCSLEPGHSFSARLYVKLLIRHSFLYLHGVEREPEIIALCWDESEDFLSPPSWPVSSNISASSCGVRSFFAMSASCRFRFCLS